jgi:hypothetical protein
VVQARHWILLGKKLNPAFTCKTCNDIAIGVASHENREFRIADASDHVIRAPG